MRSAPLILAMFGILPQFSVSAPPSPTVPANPIAEAETPTKASAQVTTALALRGRDLESAIAADRSLAIFHSWEQCARGQLDSQSKDERARLVGRIEGHLGIACPQRWINILYETDLPFKRVRESQSIKYKDIGGGWRSLGQDIEMHETDLFIKTSSGRTLLMRVPTSRETTQSIEYARGPEAGQYVLAFPPTGSRDYEITLVDTVKNKALWRSRVWSTSFVLSSGVPLHYCFLVVGRSQCVVFGADPHAVYIESFDVDTGKPMVR